MNPVKVEPISPEKEPFLFKLEVPEFEEEITEEFKVFTEPVSTFPSPEESFDNCDSDTASEDDATSVYILPDNPTTSKTAQLSVANLLVRRGPRQFVCKLCRRCCESITQFKIHVRVHTGERPYPCEVPGCLKTFKRLGDRTRHLKSVHTAHNNFKCRKCSAAYCRKDSLKEHVRQMHSSGKKVVERRPYICETCGKAFPRLNTLGRHLTLVHDGKGDRLLHKCVFCAREFPSLKWFYVHLRSHVEEKPYICKKCGMEYASEKSLKSHKNSKH